MPASHWYHKRSSSRVDISRSKRYGTVFEILLLRSALHTLGTAGHVIIVILHAGAGGTVGAGLLAFAALDTLQLKVLDHGVSWGLGLLETRGEDLLQEVQVLELVLLGELDIELDVQVAVVVVAERGHTLAGDDLDGIWKRLAKLSKGWWNRGTYQE